MATLENNPGVIPPDLMAELLQAAQRAATGVRDPEAMRQAADARARNRSSCASWRSASAALPAGYCCHR